MVVRLTEMAKVLVTCDQNTLSILVVGLKEMAKVLATCDQKTCNLPLSVLYP